jgi:hypothetical protein
MIVGSRESIVRSQQQKTIKVEELPFFLLCFALDFSECKDKAGRASGKAIIKKKGRFD